VRNLTGKGKRPSKWPIPKRISDRDFEELVTPAGSKSRDFEIPRCYAEEAKKALDTFVDYIAAEMQTPASNKKAVRAALASAVRALSTAQKRLRDVLNSDQARVGVNAMAIAAIVNDQWLRKFSQGEFQPDRQTRTSSGGNDGLAKREAYVEQYPFEIADELVSEIEAALTSSFEWMTAINRRGGREAFPYGKVLIGSLANMCESWGRSLKMGPRSSFVVFCENVFQYVGWDSTGVQSLVSRVLSKRKAGKARAKGRFQN
jgi:hypothetical protein